MRVTFGCSIALMLLAVPAQAQRLQRYYVIVDPYTPNCSVLDQQPTNENLLMRRLASDAIYISRADAEAAIKTLPLCQPRPSEPKSK